MCVTEWIGWGGMGRCIGVLTMKNRGKEIAKGINEGRIKFFDKHLR